MKLPHLLLVTAILVSACSDDGPAPKIYITDEVLNPVSDHLFGHFMEKCSWGGEIGGDLVIDPHTGSYDSTVLAKLKAMEIPNLRYPGGSDVDYFEWTDLVDHAPGQTERKPYRRYRQGPDAEIVSDNRLGLDEFLQLCEILEAEPILVVNIGDAFHRKTTIEEAKASAAALYSYCNREAGPGNRWAEYRKMNGRGNPYAVRYFEIGNEYWGFRGFNWNRTYADTSLIPHLYRCIEAVADTLLALDPEVRIIVDGALPRLNDLMEANMREKIAYIVFHTYVPWGISRIYKGDSGRVEPDTLTAEDVWNAWVATPVIDPATGLSALPSDRYHSSALNTPFPVAVTEWNWNGWFVGQPREADLPQPDLAKGVGAAGFLHAFMRMGRRIEMACQSMTVGQSWGITGIRVDPDYKQDPVYLPTAQVTGLYSNYHGDRLLHAVPANIPAYGQPLRMNAIRPAGQVACMDILATRSGRHLYIHAINRNFNEGYNLEVELEGLKTASAYLRHTLTGDKTAGISNEDLEQAAEIVSTPFTHTRGPLVVGVPPASVSVFAFDLE